MSLPMLTRTTAPSTHSATSSVSASGAPSRSSLPWVHGPLADVLLGWCWLPIALLMHAFESNITRTQALMGIIFLISFAHQPLTLGLVYADRAQREAHRRFYTWTPFVAIALIAIGLNVSLTVVALMAGLWNAEHTLMQRYGVLRIYGRKAGDDHGRLEKPMLITWLVTALLFLGAYVDLNAVAAKLGIGGTNKRSLDILHSVSHVLMPVFWIGAVVSVVMAVRWVRAESGRPPSIGRRAKWIYAAGTLGLVVAVMIDPLAGIAGYVAAHAIEYFGIVHSSLRRRSSSGDDSTIAKVTATPRRRVGLYVAYFAVIAALMIVTLSLGDGRTYGYAILFFGALHILYDGFVWKLRKPVLAASLGITPALQAP
ncbi:MAG: hypothetical protein JWM34_843 [Ilumatobacteraceae bacterium]|nr:hypothetical protein [Ilumatobacteraceae bacterium]